MKDDLKHRCEDLYIVGGASAVFDYCQSIDHKDYGDCDQCQTYVPIYKDCCLLCGTELKKVNKTV